ncbi:MAG: hypothetical protein U0002_11310 [Thermoanaerobaculia bacterium]
MILKIILVGIMTLVPNKPWEENPTEVMVLLNSGGAGSHAVQHDALLFVDPSELGGDPLPNSTIAVIAERDCSSGAKVAMRGAQAVVDIAGKLLYLDQGLSPLDKTQKLQVVKCGDFQSRFAQRRGAATDHEQEELEENLKRPCPQVSNSLPPRFVANDIRWVLSANELGGRPLPAAVSKATSEQMLSHADNLVAVLSLTRGLLETNTLSGGASVQLNYNSQPELVGKVATWEFGLPNRGPGPGQHPITFAGSLALSVAYTSGNGEPLKILSKNMLNNDSMPKPLVALKYKANATVEIRIENVPLREVLTRNPCRPAPQTSLVEHVELVYGLLRGGMGLKGYFLGREIPFAVSRSTSAGRDLNRAKCEPMVSAVPVN